MEINSPQEFYRFIVGLERFAETKHEKGYYAKIEGYLVMVSVGHLELITG